MNVTTAVVDIQVLCRRIVADGIRILQEFHARYQFICCAVEDLQVARVSIRYVNAVQIFPVEHGVRLANAVYLMDQFACLQVKHNHSMVALGSRKQPPALEVNSEMVEVAFNLRRQVIRLDQLDWCSHLTPGLDSEEHENRYKDARPFLHFLSPSWCAFCMKNILLLRPRSSSAGLIRRSSLRGDAAPNRKWGCK